MSVKITVYGFGTEAYVSHCASCDRDTLHFNGVCLEEKAYLNREELEAVEAFSRKNISHQMAGGR